MTIAGIRYGTVFKIKQINLRIVASNTRNLASKSNLACYCGLSNVAYVLMLTNYFSLRFMGCKMHKLR